MTKLTIAIPTFDRNDTLNESLVHLLPQLTADCRLIILDNHSPRPVAETAAAVLARFPGTPVEIRRNRWNIGPTANILRCFECCETDWNWVLGDDDIVLPDAIGRILKVTEENPDAFYLSFVTQKLKESGARKKTTLAYGVKGFADELDMVGLVNFMSCSVWRTEVFGRHLASGFNNAYSNGWTFALLLSALGDAGEVVFSEEAVIKTATTAPMSNRWSYRKFVLGWATLLEIPSSIAVRKTLAGKVLGFLSPENVTAYLLADAATRPWPGHFLYYDLAVGRLCPYRIHRCGWFRFALYRPLFAAPRIGWRFVKAVIAVANCLGIKSIDIADLEGRGNS